MLANEIVEFLLEHDLDNEGDNLAGETTNIPLTQKDIENAIDIVVSVGGKTFDWTKEHCDARNGVDGYYVKKEDFGVIAQDMQAVFPLAVNVRDNGTLAVDYPKMVAIAFAAIKEQQQQIDKLVAQVAQLMNK